MQVSNRFTKRAAAGFTLIEVMIVVAILGILASVALPAYTDYVRRGNLPEAFTTLSNMRVQMEQYYQDNKSYANGGACGVAIPTSKLFTFTCATNNGGQSYEIVATGKSGTSVVDHVYKLDNTNAKSTTKFKGTSVTASCWLVKSTSDC